MAQKLKENVREKILKSALEIFAKKGYRDTSMVEVSRRASISAGNIYRYFPDKKALYEAAVPQDSLQKLSFILKEKIGGSGGSGSNFITEHQNRFRVELIELLMENRLHWVVLLREGFGTVIVDELCSFFCSWLQSNGYGSIPEKNLLTIRMLYQNLTSLICSMLNEHVQTHDMKTALENCLTYHMAGIQALLEKWRKQ